MTHSGNQGSLAQVGLAQGGAEDSLPSPEQLLASSAVRPRLPIVPVLMVAAVATAIGLWQTSAPTQGAEAARAVLAMVVPLGLLGIAVAVGSSMRRRILREQQTVEEAEGSIRFRRYDRALWLLLGVLSGAMISPFQRARALGMYVAVLGRLGRHEQTVKLVEMMLEEGVLLSTVPALRTVRIHALLREDRLVDADRAITELKRSGREGHTGALLALAEAYRDVRTGHGGDLLEAHDRRRAVVASEIGTRVADLYALAAWAARRGGDIDKARQFWRRATLLGIERELVERYPELSDVARELPAEPLPPELRIADPRPAWGNWGVAWGVR